jgi:hypothetical protein
MIPTAVDVLGKRYSVNMIEHESTVGNDYGECFVDQCRIEIATYQCDEQKRDTLLHEAMHAIDHELNCRMSEAQIRRMATGLLALLRQNPDLSAFLLAVDA